MDFLGGLFNAAGGIASAIIGQNAAKKAAQASAQANAQNLQADQQVSSTAAANLQPFVGYGQQGSGALAGLLGIGGNPQASQKAFQDYLGSTNYNFLLNQGLQGQGYLNAPNLFSGATSKALGNYAQGMAGNALYPYEGFLMGLGNQGIQASTNLGNIQTNLAGLEQQSRLANAGVQGSAALYGAGGWQSALGGLGNLFGQSSFGGSGLGSGLSAFGQALGGNFTGASNILGLPGSATAQEGAFGNVAGLF